MEFRYYEPSLEHAAKISVDGLCPDSLHLSHRPGNATPGRYKADLSVEIARRFVDDPDDPRADHDLVVDDRFDTDGLFGVWTVLQPRESEPHADLLADAAAAGDFAEWPTDEAVQLDLLVEEYRHGPESPLSFKVDDWGPARADAVIFEVLLEMLPALLGQVGDYEYVWWDAWERLTADRDGFADGTFTCRSEGPVTRVEGPRLPAATATADACDGPLYLYAVERQDGTGYRLDAAYHSWAETVDRPTVDVPDVRPLAAELNGLDEGDGRWMVDGYADRGPTEMLRYTDARGRLAASTLGPDEVQDRVRALLS